MGINRTSDVWQHPVPSLPAMRPSAAAGPQFNDLPNRAGTAGVVVGEFDEVGLSRIPRHMIKPYVE